MAKLWIRLGLAGISLASLVFAGMAMVIASRTPADAASSHIVEILDSGFNPEICTVNGNGDSVRWKNKSSKVRHVVVPDLGGVDNPPLWESEDIAPGATSVGSLQFDLRTTRIYFDRDEPTMIGTIIAVTGAAQCSPLPPTPTPTPTRTPTPTPTATPRATPTQKPPRCIGLEGCAVAPQISQDGNDE